MDTKEALKELEDLTVDYGDRNEEQIARLDEAIDMAMDALRNLPNRLRQAMDTISRKGTIEAIQQHFNPTGEELPTELASVLAGVGVVIGTMPPAQPEKHTEERTETHACDLIDRQAAIDAFKPYADYESNRTNADWVRRIELVLHDLPSAQPEIVRCKDCKHQVKEWRTDKRLKDKGYMVCGCEVVGDACGYWALLGQDDDYCSYAERRTDEQTD